MKNLLVESILLVRCFCHKFKVIRKKDSKFHRFIGWILKPINNNYMTGYYTTIGYTCAYPYDELPQRSWSTILHEGLHAIQSKKYTRFGMGFLYLLDIIVLCLVLLATPFVFINGWKVGLIYMAISWPLSIAFKFLFLSYFRYKFEQQAYAINMLCDHMCGYDISDSGYIQRLCNVFTSPGYGWMWIYRESLEKTFQTIALEIEQGTYNQQRPYIQSIRSLVET